MKRVNKFPGYKEEFLINRLVDDSKFGIVDPNDDKSLEYRLAHFSGWRRNLSDHPNVKRGFIVYNGKFLKPFKVIKPKNWKPADKEEKYDFKIDKSKTNIYDLVKGKKTYFTPKNYPNPILYVSYNDLLKLVE